MAVGAWDFFALIWNHPIISCLVLLLFTPALFPVVVYFSPLLISTALCAIALISMNMGESPETEEDPYVRRWQSEQVEREQSKPARQSWFQWVRKAEEKTRLWVDGRFSKGKPTKIKYGKPAEEEEEDAKEDDRQAHEGPNKSIGATEPTLTSSSKHVPIGAQQEEEIQSVVGENVHPGIVLPPNESDIIGAPSAAAAGVVYVATTKVSAAVAAAATPSKHVEKPISSGLHVLAEAIQHKVPATSNQKAGANPSTSTTTPSQPKLRVAPAAERRGDGSSETSRDAGGGVAAQRLVQDHAGHAPPSLDNASPDAAQSPPVKSARMATAAAIAAANTAPSRTTMSSSPRDAKSSSSPETTASAARSLANSLAQTAAVNNEALSEKVRTPRSLPTNLVPTEAIVETSSDPSGPAAPAPAPPEDAAPSSVSDSPNAPENPTRTPVPMRLPSMNERVAEARMMKPEPSAYNVEDIDTDSPFLDAKESEVEEPAVAGRAEGDQLSTASSRSGLELGEPEIGRRTSSGSGGVDVGSKKLGDSGSKGVAELGIDRSTDFEKVIFVDESSKVGNNFTVAGQQQQRGVGDGVKLHSEVAEVKGSGPTKTEGGLDVLDSDQLLGLSDKKGKSKERLEDICGSGVLGDGSCIVGRATISSRSIEDERNHVSEPNQFDSSILERRDRLQGSEEKSTGSSFVGDSIKPGSDGNGAQQEQQQQEQAREGEGSDISGSGTRSIDARCLVDRRKSENDLKVEEAENLCAVQTSDGTSTVVDRLNAKRRRDELATDQLQNLIEDGKNLPGSATTSESSPNSRPGVVGDVEGTHEIVPFKRRSEADEVVSGATIFMQPDVAQRIRSLNIKEDKHDGEKEAMMWSPTSVGTPSVRNSTDSRNAWVKANKEEEFDEYMKEYLSLKKSSSLPASNRPEGGARASALALATLGKATSLPEKKKRGDDDSDTDSEAVVSTRRKPWTKIHNMDSVEEITARLSKKYNWAKIATTKDGAGTSRPVTALASIDAPKPIEPEIFAINSPKVPRYISPMRRGIDPEKSEDAAESYMSPMKKVMSAVRNVGSKDKDSSGKNGPAQPHERKGLSSVLNIKRERFISPLKRVFTSESEGGKKSGSTNERKGAAAAAKEKVGITAALAVLAEEEAPVGSTDKFKDRLMTPLKKVFSTDANGGGKKADIALEATPEGSTLPVKGSPAQKPLSGKDEAGTDKFRDRFILPLKKKFSSDSSGGKKGDSAIATAHTPEKRGLPAATIDSSGEIGLGATSTFDRLKSPEKKFSLSWPKKRVKDDQSPAPPAPAPEALSPGSIFQKPRSPGISEKATARIISHGKSYSIPSVSLDESGYSTDELLSPDRNLFRPPSKQQEKEREKEKQSAQLSKEKAAGSRTSWWNRKRDKVVVEEATVAQARQPTRDDARSSPERVIGGRNVDRNSPASPLLRRLEKDEQLLAVRSSPSEERASPSRMQHRREHSDTLPTRFRGHERRMSLSELSTPEKEASAAERLGIVDQNVSMPERLSIFDKSDTARRRAQHARQRSVDVMAPRAEAHLYKSRSAIGAADHAQERCRNEIVPFSGSRSDPEVNKLYRNLESPSNAEIRITDKLKVPLEEVLSLLAAGDSSTRNSTAARESSSSEETSSSEEEWSSSSDEDEAGAFTVQKAIQPVQSRKSHHFFNKGNRQLRNVDA
ncbi:hypothetical protein Mapa_005601 [Marchantia paleacea]|nr:hypothetical protein Mapa_005601 [Marchantia paleacea]